MCTLLFSIKQSDEFPFVLAANRDEFLKRPALPMDWWTPNGFDVEVISGIDEEAGGTWLAVDKRGRLAAVTNVRHPKYFTTKFEKSRGELPLSWIANGKDDSAFNKDLALNGEKYSGYNFVFGSFDRLSYYSNHKGQTSVLSGGLYGLSNDELDTPWPKVLKGKKALEESVTPGGSQAVLHERIIEFLSDRSTAPAQDLPDTGIGLDLEKPLSALNIQMDGYGTRVSTAVSLHRSGSVFVTELNQQTGEKREFDFQLG